MRFALLSACLSLLAAAPGDANDTISLQGPPSVPAGSTGDFIYSAAPFQAKWALAAGLSNAGSVIKGHQFDIGPGFQIVARGNTGFIGSGTITVFFPAAAAGRTVYLELGALQGGTLFDSNLVAVKVL